jgi:ribosomal protein S18 acetylase RimI-like enzyme
VTVRRATEADAGALAGTLARAFFDDPVIGWALPDEERRMRGAERMFGMQLSRWLRFEEVHTEEGLRAAALWAPPGEWRWPPLAGLRMLLGAGLPALPRMLRGFGRIEHAHPTDPHYYLAVLGTDPSAQGEGLGSAVLGPVLETCDRDGVPAYLESSKERNIAYYGRHGFKVTGEVQLPGGPAVWPMWREPRGSGAPVGV